MRYVKIRMEQDSPIHPIEERIAANPEIHRKAIHHFNVLEDGTATTLYELEGDREAGMSIVEHPDILSYSISESGESIFSYTHFRPNETTKQLYEVGQKHEIMTDLPVTYTEDGALEATIIGEIESIRGAVPDLPRDLNIELLSTGEYLPTSEKLFRQLTDRQQEILRVAVEEGYYENPRDKTYDDLAGELDLAGGTVGEHLREVESRIMQEVVPDTTGR